MPYAIPVGNCRSKLCNLYAQCDCTPHASMHMQIGRLRLGACAAEPSQPAVLVVLVVMAAVAEPRLVVSAAAVENGHLSRHPKPPLFRQCRTADGRAGARPSANCRELRRRCACHRTPTSPGITATRAALGVKPSAGSALRACHMGHGGL